MEKLTNKLGVLTGPEFSPDGKSIVFTRGNARGKYQIMVMDRNGKSADNIPNAAGWDPTWSPDGSYIIYVARVSGNEKLFRLDLDSGKKTQLTFGTHDDAAARYLDRVCGVKGINPETEVLHSIGSKAALSILPAALINPGDYVLMTTPGYPVFGTHSKYYGGLVHNLPLTESNQFLPDLDSVTYGNLGRGETLRKSPEEIS